MNTIMNTIAKLKAVREAKEIEMVSWGVMDGGYRVEEICELLDISLESIEWLANMGLIEVQDIAGGVSWTSGEHIMIRSDF